MSNILNTEQEQNYWTSRYHNNETGWDIGSPSTPIKSYIDQLEDKHIKILIPGAGNAYEAEYLFNNGFKNVFVLDISKLPLEELKKRSPNFPDKQLIHQNFFEHQGQYDLILEQTFFCSFPPTKENRESYSHQMWKSLKKCGKLVGLWFDIPLTGDLEKRPFGGDKAEYLNYLNPYFKVKTFTTANNSIKPRAGKELFGIFEKRQEPLNK